MSNWDEIRKTVGRAASGALKKTEEMAGLTSLYFKLKRLESKRQEKYQELGRLTYRQLKTGESQAAKISPLIEELDAVRGEIRALSAEIKEAKQAIENRKSLPPSES